MKNNVLQLAEISILYNPKVKPSERMKISLSADAETIFRKIWAYPLELKECFYALYLNRCNKVLGYQLVSVGGLTGTVIDIRNILQTALKANACAILLAHNHPSGNPTPSDNDIQMTRRIKEAATIMDFSVLDHLIILTEGYYSFSDEGRL